LTYTSDAVSAFITDLQRIGRGNDVVVMMFSEFGRRVPENSNLGTDHGAANLMFVAGQKVKGGHYGKIPSLTQLDEGDNLVYTTDFRRVYATMISGWLGFKDTAGILNGNFEAFDMFAVWRTAACIHSSSWTRSFTKVDSCSLRRICCRQNDSRRKKCERDWL